MMHKTPCACRTWETKSGDMETEQCPACAAAARKKEEVAAARESVKDALMEIEDRIEILADGDTDTAKLCRQRTKYLREMLTEE